MASPEAKAVAAKAAADQAAAASPYQEAGGGANAVVRNVGLVLGSVVFLALSLCWGFLGLRGGGGTCRCCCKKKYTPRASTSGEGDPAAAIDVELSIS